MAEPRKPAWYEKKDILEEENQDVASPLGRPEAVPSWKSVSGLLVVLMLFTLILESCEKGWERPMPSDMVYFLKTGIVLVNVAAMCAAAEGAGSTPIKQVKRMYMPRKKFQQVDEAVPEGLVKRMAGGKTEFKPKLD